MPFLTPVLPSADSTMQDVEMVFWDSGRGALQNESLHVSGGDDFGLLESTDQTGKVSLKNIALSGLSFIQPARTKEVKS